MAETSEKTKKTVCSGSYLSFILKDIAGNQDYVGTKDIISSLGQKHPGRNFKPLYVQRAINCGVAKGLIKRKGKVYMLRPKKAKPVQRAEKKTRVKKTTTTTSTSQDQAAKWQYMDDSQSWQDYDSSAASELETRYQSYISGSQTSADPVPSGSHGWRYDVNFQTMIQTNVDHIQHKQRPIRRIT